MVNSAPAVRDVRVHKLTDLARSDDTEVASSGIKQHLAKSNYAVGGSGLNLQCPQPRHEECGVQAWCACDHRLAWRLDWRRLGSGTKAWAQRPREARHTLCSRQPWSSAMSPLFILPGRAHAALRDPATWMGPTRRVRAPTFKPCRWAATSGRRVPACGVSRTAASLLPALSCNNIASMHSSLASR